MTLCWFGLRLCRTGWLHKPFRMNFKSEFRIRLIKVKGGLFSRRSSCAINYFYLPLSSPTSSCIRCVIAFSYLCLQYETSTILREQRHKHLRLSARHSDTQLSSPAAVIPTAVKAHYFGLPLCFLYIPFPLVETNKTCRMSPDHAFLTIQFTFHPFDPTNACPFLTMLPFLYI